jgi:hypothetical protein
VGHLFPPVQKTRVMSAVDFVGRDMTLVDRSVHVVFYHIGLSLGKGYHIALRPVQDSHKQLHLTEPRLASMTSAWVFAQV